VKTGDRLKVYFDTCQQDTCTGFLLGGVGELDKNRRPNFFVVEKSMYLAHLR